MQKKVMKEETTLLFLKRSISTRDVGNMPAAGTHLRCKPLRAMMVWESLPKRLCNQQSYRRQTREIRAKLTPRKVIRDLFLWPFESVKGC